MTKLDPYTYSDTRYPRVITSQEIESMPRMIFEDGIDNVIFLSMERDDARQFRQGYCFPRAKHTPYTWKQGDFDETHYCLRGKIRLRVKDAAGREVILEAGVGEHIYLPAGYEYTLEPSGVDTTFFWTSGPSPRRGLTEIPDYSKTLTELRGELTHD